MGFFWQMMEVTKGVSDCYLTYDRIIEFTTHAQLSQHEISKQRQIGKFTTLKTATSCKQSKPDRNPKERWVKNLSNRELTECEEKVLSRGLNFAVAPNVPPVNDIITATESAIRRGNLSESSASELRHDVANIILQNKTIKPNISKEEKKAIKDLGNDKQGRITA